MDYIETNVKQTIPTNIERTYTAKEIADEHNVTDATVRNRWYDWLCKVAPPQLLKCERSYTELARTLFGEFAQVHKTERHAWVADAKQRYSSEWSNVGIIDCEVMPDNVGGVLALLQTNNNALQQTIELELSQTQQFVEQLNTADADFSQAEMESFIAAGTRKAIAQFKAEEIARAQALNALRQQRMQGGNSAK